MALCNKIMVALPLTDNVSYTVPFTYTDNFTLDGYYTEQTIDFVHDTFLCQAVDW